MDELARFALCGDEVVPAARDVRLGVEAEDALADGVAVVMIVEEPAIEPGFAQRGLNRIEIHKGNDTRMMAAGWGGDQEMFLRMKSVACGLSL